MIRRSNEDRSGAKTAQGHTVRDSYDKKGTHRDRNTSSLIASEYENMSEYAKYHRDQINTRVVSHRIPAGVYNNGKRIMFKGMGKTILPHDHHIEMIDNGQISSRAGNASKGETIEFK